MLKNLHPPKCTLSTCNRKSMYTTVIKKGPRAGEFRPWCLEHRPKSYLTKTVTTNNEELKAVAYDMSDSKKCDRCNLLKTKKAFLKGETVCRKCKTGVSYERSKI